MFTHVIANTTLIAILRVIYRGKVYSDFVLQIMRLLLMLYFCTDSTGAVTVINFYGFTDRKHIGSRYINSHNNHL